MEADAEARIYWDIDAAQAPGLKCLTVTEDLSQGLTNGYEKAQDQEAPFPARIGETGSISQHCGDQKIPKDLEPWSGQGNAIGEDKFSQGLFPFAEPAPQFLFEPAPFGPGRQGQKLPGLDNFFDGRWPQLQRLIPGQRRVNLLSGNQIGWLGHDVLPIFKALLQTLQGIPGRPKNQRKRQQQNQAPPMVLRRQNLKRGWPSGCSR